MAGRAGRAALVTQMLDLHERLPAEGVPHEKAALQRRIEMTDRHATGGRAEHEQRTAEIVRMETELNARVYALFDLTPAEIRIIEESTKYRYGEV